MRIAIATCNKEPHLATSDKPLISLFAASGINAIPAVWNDPSINWQNFDAVLIRSVWDYHLHPAKFTQWLNMLQSLGICTLNPAHIVLQNMHKFYLQKLQQQGVAIIPTLFIPYQSFSLQAVQLQGWQKAVIKPAVSASAYLTQIFTAVDIPVIEQQLQPYQIDWLVQPFIKEIQSQGEISLLFFNRSFSHAVIKTPAHGDFRVQKEYGGSTYAFNPPQHIINSALNTLKLIKGELLYARVDGVILTMSLP